MAHEAWAREGDFLSPGARARAEQLFPDRVFRQAYERLRRHEERRADAHYVQVLALAAERGEAAVSAILAECLRNGEIPLPEQLRYDGVET